MLLLTSPMRYMYMYPCLQFYSMYVVFYRVDVCFMQCVCVFAWEVGVCLVLRYRIGFFLSTYCNILVNAPSLNWWQWVLAILQFVQELLQGTVRTARTSSCSMQLQSQMYATLKFDIQWVESAVIITRQWELLYTFNLERQLKCVKLNSTCSTCANHPPNPMFDHLLESSW